MDPTIVYSVQPGPHWDWKVALDLFLGGAGVGAFAVAVGVRQAFQGRYPRICQTAAWLSPVLVVLGLAMLLMKLGRPYEFYLTFKTIVPTAPLWWGGIFQSLFVVGSAWYAFQWRDLSPYKSAREWCGWLLLPVAVIVGAYHGLLLAVITARPLWNTGPTVVAAMFGFGTTGIAAVMLTHLVRMKIAGRLVDNQHLHDFLHDMEPVRTTLVAMLLLQLGTFCLWWLSLNSGDLADQQALAAANAGYGPMFWLLGIGAGLVLPLILGAYAVWRGKPKYWRLEVNMIGLTSALILIGGAFFRLAVVLGGQAGTTIPSLS